VARDAGLWRPAVGGGGDGSGPGFAGRLSMRQNTGNTDWQPGQYRPPPIGSQDPPNNGCGASTGNLPGPVRPARRCRVAFEAVRRGSGDLKLQWRMARGAGDGVRRVERQRAVAVQTAYGCPPHAGSSPQQVHRDGAGRVPVLGDDAEHQPRMGRPPSSQYRGLTESDPQPQLGRPGDMPHPVAQAAR